LVTITEDGEAFKVESEGDTWRFRSRFKATMAATAVANQRAMKEGRGVLISFPRSWGDAIEVRPNPHLAARILKSLQRE
jgi:hypothetical protein